MSEYFIRPVQPEDVVSSMIAQKWSTNDRLCIAAHHHSVNLRVGTICLPSIAPSCVRSSVRRQAVYEKAPQLAVATPELVSMPRETRGHIETSNLCRSQDIYLKPELRTRLLHFLELRRLLERQSVLHCTFSTSRRGPVNQDYTCVACQDSSGSQS